MIEKATSALWEYYYLFIVIILKYTEIIFL